jgi:transposase
MECSLSKLSCKPDTTAAIQYALARWDALVLYCDDGRIEIDTSAAESALRAIALGRENDLFAGSDRGWGRAAGLYSLLGSAKLNCLNPEAHLRKVLECTAAYPVNLLEQLLPWNIGWNDPAMSLALR